MSSLAAFLAERYPPMPTIPMALLIGTVLVDPATAELSVILQAAVFTWLVLLVARGIDDLTSVDEDRLRHRDRGLVSGRIDGASLSRGLTAAALAALLISPGLETLALCGAFGAILWAAFLWRRSLPLLVWPLISNAIFLLPGFWCLLEPTRSGPATLPIAVALWLGGAAHHWLHSEFDGGPDPSVRLGLLLSAGGTLAALTGFLTAPGISTAPLAAAFISYTVTLLLASPWRPAYIDRHEAFYVWGYLAVLLPLTVWCLARTTAGSGS